MDEFEDVNELYWVKRLCLVFIEERIFICKFIGIGFYFEYYVFIWYYFVVKRIEMCVYFRLLGEYVDDYYS